MALYVIYFSSFPANYCFSTNRLVPCSFSQQKHQNTTYRSYSFTKPMSYLFYNQKRSCYSSFLYLLLQHISIILCNNFIVYQGYTQAWETLPITPDTFSVVILTAMVKSILRLHYSLPKLSLSQVLLLYVRYLQQWLLRGVILVELWFYVFYCNIYCTLSFMYLHIIVIFILL